MNHPEISHRILLTMKNLGLTQKEFARLLGVTQPAVSNYLKGRIPPGPVLLRIAQIGSVSLEWLLVGDKEKELRVAEQKTHYTLGDRIAQKIDRLSPDLQKTIENLIDHISNLDVADRNK